MYVCVFDVLRDRLGVFHHFFKDNVDMQLVVPEDMHNYARLDQTG